MTKYLTEYRLNKKGAECFRSVSLENIMHRYNSFSNQAQISIQYRTVQLDRYGVALSSADGRTLWSTWMKLKG